MMTNYVFIDNENVNVSIQKLGWKIDRGKFIKLLKKEYHAEKIFMFMGYLKKYQSMYDFFNNLGYTLVFKVMNPNPKIPNKGNIDAEMVLHTMIEYPNYNKAVIVTGDGDFACLIEYLKQQKKLSQLIVPNKKRYAYSLKEASGGKILMLDDFQERLEYKLEKEPEIDESYYDAFYS